MNQAQWDVLRAAIGHFLDWPMLVVVAGSACYGIAIGSIPGLTATMAVALLVPLTFFLDDVQAIAAIVTTVTCSIFAGDLPATLVRIPGTPASAAYVDDAYAFTRRGQHVFALTTSLLFSVIGGLIGSAVLIFAAPVFAQLAAEFTSYEYFWLYLLGLSCAVMVSHDSKLRGIFALLLGLLLSTVGLGTDFATPRLTFGFNELITGISFIPAMIGLFGMSEVLRNVITLSPHPLPEVVDTVSDRQREASPWRTLTGQVAPLAWRRKAALLRSSLLGSVVGMLPGAGADMAAWISYAVSKRFSREPNQYGHGSIEGLGDATGANNAAVGGAWIPALVFGIPGDSVTAIALGVLMMKNVTPGPTIFNASENPAQATLVASIFITFIVANLIMIPVGLAAIRGGSLLIRVPSRILLPVIVVFCVVGSFAMSGSYVDIWIMLAMGVLGFVLERCRIPLGPVVLGLILGGELEHRFLQSITASSNPLAFVDRPITAILAIITLLFWIVPSLRKRGRGQA